VISIVLADDHQVVRKGLQALLSAEPGFEVVGEACDGLETIRVVEELKPNVLILDLMMNGVNGLEVARQLTKATPQTSIVILSMHSNEAYVLEALRSGARAYVLKESPSDELVRAIREVSVGHCYLAAPLSERAIEAYTQKTSVKPSDPYEHLTTREREILQLTAQGCNNAEIAAKLFISPRTVETHRTNLMRKLDLANRTQLLRYAIQHGIVSNCTT
jgi:two-component system, NarL family, response regulator NreC